VHSRGVLYPIITQFNYAQVLSGHSPYHGSTEEFAVCEILEGKRPKKPKMAARRGFTKKLWKVLEQCWAEDRNRRPALEVVLSALNNATPHWEKRKSIRTFVTSALADLRHKRVSSFTHRLAVPLQMLSGLFSFRHNGGLPSLDCAAFISTLARLYLTTSASIRDVSAWVELALESRAFRQVTIVCLRSHNTSGDCGWVFLGLLESFHPFSQKKVATNVVSKFMYLLFSISALVIYSAL